MALFLVDQRMPRKSGVEFLEEARELFPDAKKVLLTAYADTDAAIKAINAIGLDYYLQKPWDPPEENLYPILDDLLGDWRSSYRPPFEGIRVVGNRWSPRSHVVKNFLARNRVPYQWQDVDASEEARQLVAQVDHGDPRLPIVVFPDGTYLEAPENVEVAEKVGLQTRAERPFYDLIIVGGGPSGLAAAVYGASEGLNTVLIEREAPGGQAGTSSRASRTTLASRRALAGRTCRSGRSRRPRGSRSRSSRPRRSQRSGSRTRTGWYGSRTARRSAATPSSSLPASPIASWTYRAWNAWLAGASTTAPQ